MSPLDSNLGETSVYLSTAKIDVMESIDSIHPNENNKSSTLSGVGLCKVRLELFDNKNNTKFNI
jgi:hypothetical protein